MRILGVTIPAGVARVTPTFLSAVTLGALIVLSRLLLQDVLGAEAPFILAWPGILLAAFIGGFWPAILVTTLSVGVAQHVLVLGGKAPLGVGAIGIFAIFGLVFAVAGHLRKRGLSRAKEYAQRLAATQAQMVQVARLNAMGEVAGSLTHELNQPLTAVSNYLSAARHLLAGEAQINPRIDELLGRAADQAVRAGQIVARARANVDRGEIEASQQSLSGLVREAVDLAIAGAAKESVVVRYDFDRSGDLVMADRLQVQQVVLNLVRNAIEAMAASPRRELRIGSAAEPDFIQCYVADSGPGVSPDVAERLFEPFVTDKPAGMGVGLSISRSIIEAHGGRIWADTAEDGGAAFRFSIPRADAESAAA